jgi:hypothetical protein
MVVGSHAPPAFVETLGLRRDGGDDGLCSNGIVAQGIASGT